MDVYFENVGGTVFEAVLPWLNNFARILVWHCGHAGDAGAPSTPGLAGRG
jgi:NADPH-dependent curcumin reductase CurA